MITKEQAINLKKGAEIHYHRPDIKIVGMTNQALNKARNMCVKYRVNAKIRVWKKKWPERFSLGLKHGLYDFGVMTEENSEYFYLPEDCKGEHK